MKCILKILATISFVVVGTVPASETVKKETAAPRIPAEQVKTHFKLVEMLDSTKHGLFKQLQKTYGIHTDYTVEEIQDIENPAKQSNRTVKKLADGSRTSKNILGDALPSDEVKQYYDQEKLYTPGPKTPPMSDSFVASLSAPQLASMSDTQLAAITDGQLASLTDVQKSKLTAAQLTTLTKGRIVTVEKVYGKQGWYEAPEVRDIAANGEKIKPPATITAAMAMDANSVPRSGFIGPLIRHDWTDVLLSEDPSQDIASTKKVGDLVGATFSYARDNKAGTDTWNSVGSLIVPWHWYKTESGEPLLPDYGVIAPSISINRISSNSPSTSNVDQIIHRLGFYGDWLDSIDSVPKWDIQARIAAVYATDTSYRARMPGYEADIEPSIEFCKEVKLGYKNILVPKAPLIDDRTDNSLVDLQVRAWLHMEGGDVQDNGKTWVAAPGAFFRMGPTTQLRFNINGPFNWQPFFKSFSLTAQYSYLSDIQGPNGHDSLFSATAGWTIFQDATAGQKLSLTATYTKGGVIFIKQDVDTFTVGLSLLF